MSAPLRIAPLALALALAVVTCLAAPRAALAQAARGQSVPVLAIDTDDSDEQADALTNAIRSHLRDTPGWSVMETTQSLSMLTAAFKCPQRPDPACLARIGDKLKVDQFFWGLMSKAPGHRVTVEVHLWSRGKPDKVDHETYSDNLKDANDDTLKKVATDIFGKLLGGVTGTLDVQASVDTGAVVVDGVTSGTLAGGKASLTLAAGPHVVEIQSPGYVTAKRSVTIDPAGPSKLEVTLDAGGAGAGAGQAAAGSPLPVRKIVGWSLIGGGAVLVAIGIGFGVAELNDQSDLNTQRQNNYDTGLLAPVQNPCKVPANIMTPPAMQACSDISASHTALAVEITTIAAGAVAAGAGVYLLLTDHGSSGAPASSPPPAASIWKSVRFVPAVAAGGGSMLVLGRF